MSKDEAKAAVMQSPLVNLIRAKLKEKHVDRGSYIFRWAAGPAPGAARDKGRLCVADAWSRWR